MRRGLRHEKDNQYCVLAVDTPMVMPHLPSIATLVAITLDSTLARAREELEVVCVLDDDHVTSSSAYL